MKALVGFCSLLLCLSGCGSSSSTTPAEEDTLIQPGAINTQAASAMTTNFSAVFSATDYLRTLLFIEPLLLHEEAGITCVSGFHMTSRTEVSASDADTGTSEMHVSFTDCLLASGALLNGDVTYEWSNYRSTEFEVVFDSALTRFTDFTVTLKDSQVPVSFRGVLETSYAFARESGTKIRSTHSAARAEEDEASDFTIAYGQREWLLENYATVEVETVDGLLKLEFDALMSDLGGSGDIYEVKTLDDFLLIPGELNPREGSMSLTSLTEAVTLTVISTENVSLTFDEGADGVVEQSMEMSWAQLLNY